MKNMNSGNGLIIPDNPVFVQQHPCSLDLVSHPALCWL